MEISKKLYEIIQQDVEQINNQLSSRNGSYSLWDELRVKYGIIFPELNAILNKSGAKMSTGNEFDYRPELNRVKSALLTQILVSDLDSEVNDNITSDAKTILEMDSDWSSDATLNELIEESMLYIRKTDEKEKQVGLEKIWDAFERVKTYFSENKKESISKILKEVSKGSDSLYDFLSKESRELTRIGNEFQIRHFERGKEAINSIEMKEYLYFRVLSFVSLCMSYIETQEK